METLTAEVEQPAEVESLPTSTAETESPANSPDAKGSATSPEQDKNNVLKNPKAAMEILGKDLPEVAAEDKEEVESEKSADSKPESAKTEAEKVAEKDEQAKKTAEVEAAKDAPFHKRPEWLALSELGEEAAKKFRPTLRKLLERESAVTSQLKQAEPDLHEIKALKQVVGDEQNWKFYRQVTEGFAKGDPKLIPVLEKMVEQMKVRNGLVINSPDVKGRVERGEIDEPTALEIEKARAGQTRTQAELEQAKLEREQVAQQEIARSNTNALNEWETNIRSKYADFGNVTDENDPQHGVSMADEVMSELSSRLQVKPPANQQELVATAQKAFEVVERRMKHFQPQPKSFKPVTSESSSRTAKPAPKSFKEAVDSASGILFGSQT